MASNINQVIISGNIARDPETQMTQSGVAITKFAVAVNSARKKGDEWVDEVDFIPVTVFGQQGESIAQYLGKGSKVTVVGRVQYRAVERDGDKKYYFSVVANQVEWGSKKERGGDSEQRTGGGPRKTQRLVKGPAKPVRQAPVVADDDDEDSDLPF